jgi:hypothetical protein
MLVQSFKRASNSATLLSEARAHYRGGIVLENLNKLDKAIERYQQFLNRCVLIGASRSSSSRTSTS